MRTCDQRYIALYYPVHSIAVCLLCTYSYVLGLQLEKVPILRGECVLCEIRDAG